MVSTQLKSTMLDLFNSLQDYVLEVRPTDINGP